MLRDAEQVLRSVKSLNPVIAYSGGKDAVAVAALAAKVGITAAVCDVSFYFRRQLADVKRMARALKLDCHFTEGRDDDWLRAHPKVFFACDSQTRSWSYAERQQRTVEQYAREHGHGCIIFGRRTQENTVPDVVYDRREMTVACPLRSWRTEHVVAVVEQLFGRLPWIYRSEWTRRTSAGNGPFYSFRESDVGSWRAAWELVMRLDPQYTPERYGLTIERRPRG